MFKSINHSQIVLRLALALVFLWFGADKFLHPAYWLNAWVPREILSFISRFRISGTEFVYINGIFEVLVGISLTLNIFLDFFSLLAFLFLASTLLFHGLNEVLVRDIALMGGFLALLVWPKRPSFRG